MKYRILRSVSVIALAGFATPSLAQPTEGQGIEQDVANQPDGSEAEPIVVTGFRQSLANARAEKRDAPVVQDVLSAEDIGALPTLSIAESLERLPGLAADRDRGNSSQISIRGLGPTFGLTLFNGRELSTAAPDRDVRFDQFPSEMISGAVVQKAPQADTIEGAISGTVNLKTLRPLDVNGNRVIAGQLLLDYSELDANVKGNDGLGYRGSLAYVDKFAGERIGIAIGVSYREAGVPDQRQINGFFSDPRDMNGDGTPDFIPGNIQYRYSVGTDERKGLIGAIQAEIGDSGRLTFDGFYTDREGIDRRGFLIFNGVNGATAGFNRATTTVDGNNVVDKVDFTNVGPVRVMMQDLTQRDKSGQLGVNYEWEKDNWHFNVDGAYSDTTRDRVLYQPTGQRVPGNGAASFEMNADNLYSLVSSSSLGAINNYVLQNLTLQQLDQSDKLYQGRVDIARDFGDGFFKQVAVGMFYADRRKVAKVDDDTQNFATAGAAAVPLTPFGIEFPYTDFLSGAAGAYPASFPVFDAKAVFAKASPLMVFDQEAVSDKTASYDVAEKRMAAYAKLNFGSDLGSVRFYGEIGLRYVSTLVESRGVAADILSVVRDPATGNVTNVIFGNPSPITLKNDFEDWLPNINLNFELTPELTLRLGAAKTIARPPLDSLGASRALGFDTAAGIATGSGGNPFLEPFRANQYDASLEWYFAQDGLLAVAGFIKDLDSVIFPNQPGRGVETFGGVDFQVSRPVNAENSRPLRGLEVQYQQTFSFLPGPLQYFGAVVNYTRIWNDIEFVFSPTAQYTVGLEGVSDHIFNAAAYYDDTRLSARIAYRYRSPYYRNIGGNRIDDGGQFIDANISFKVTENVTLVAQGLNLTNEPSVARHVPTSPNATGPYDNLVNYAEFNGRRFFAGVRFKF